MYDLWIWHDGESKVYCGCYSEDYCRRYCEQFSGKNGLHVQCIKRSA